VAASEANDPELNCFRFFDGTVTARDWVRTRACFERRASALKCEGSSLGLDAAQLAMMRIEGIGGTVDLGLARAALDDCFDDVTRSALLEYASDRERNPRKRADEVDFCKTSGGTTLISNDCASRALENAQAQCALQAKAVAAVLDDAGLKLLVAFESAYSDFVSAAGAFVYQVYVAGTIRVFGSSSEELALTTAHAQDLSEFRKFVAKDTSPKAVREAERDMAAALSHVSTATPEERVRLHKSQLAWTTYRDAAVALYEHAFGAQQGADRVRDALLAQLASRRAIECAPP
jgi:hypothetical protein